LGHIQSYDNVTDDPIKIGGSPTVLTLRNRAEWRDVAKFAIAAAATAGGSDARFLKALLTQCESAIKNSGGMLDAHPVPGQYKKFAVAGKEL
jgi:hypothetical protein